MQFPGPRLPSAVLSSWRSFFRSRRPSQLRRFQSMGLSSHIEAQPEGGLSLGFSPHIEAVLQGFLERHPVGALAPAERSGPTHQRKIAVFDADGTLWWDDLGESFCEHELQTGLIPLENGESPQIRFDRYLAESLNGNAIVAFGWLASWNAGKVDQELQQLAREFFLQKFGPTHVFQPMKRLIQELHRRSFEVWVVTASPQTVVAGAVEPGFGIDRNRVVGTTCKMGPGDVLTPEVERVVYRETKASVIRSLIGTEAPLLVAGNSYGDVDMLQMATEVSLVIQSEKTPDSRGRFSSEERLRLFRDGARPDWPMQFFEQVLPGRQASEAHLSELEDMQQQREEVRGIATLLS